MFFPLISTDEFVLNFIMKIAIVSFSLFFVLCAIIDTASANCECTYSHKAWGQGGCVIGRRAPPNRACKCILNGQRCSAQTIPCPWNQNSRVCRKPDISREACLLGGGECGGY